VVPLDQLWVDANFKENQLRKVRIGQPVTMTADVYGNKVVYDGKVVGLGMSTGAASALLPAQNATGNWIKVVQRVPVRVSLDPKQLREHPLRVGLSMVAKVDVADQNGPVVASGKADRVVGQTQVFDHDEAAVQALIQRTIAANLGQPVLAQPGRAAAGGRS
jgi:membrane fusion protein (multidrug efflux system)